MTRTNRGPTRRLTRLFEATGLVLLMLLAGFLVTATPIGAAPAVGAPHFVFNPTVPQSGAALRNSSYETNVGSAVVPNANTTVLGVAPANQSVQFTIGFQLQNQTALTNLLAEQEQPGSSEFQHWLTEPQEQAMFGPNPVAVQDTINYFTSLGFKVGTQGLASVSFVGDAQATTTAFKTPILSVRVNGSIGAMNQEPLSLPGEIAPYVSTVDGFTGSYFNTLPLQAAQDPFDPTASSTSPGPGPDATPAAPAGANVTNISALYNWTNHAFAWVQFPYDPAVGLNPVWQIITPPAVANMWGVDPLYNMGANGKGITIAIFMCEGLNPSDLRSWSQMVFNNPTQLTNRLVVDPIDGAWGLNGTLTWTLAGCAGETAIDTEWSSTMAPGAHIMDVLTPSLATNQIDDGYAYMEGLATPPNIISNSWGGHEDAVGNPAGPSWANDMVLEEYYELLTARGSTIMASSGDGGGFDTSTGMLTGDLPPDDPYVLSIDGIRTVAEYDGQRNPTNPNIGWVNYSIGGLGSQAGWDSQNFEFRVATETGMSTQSYWYDPYANTTLFNEPPYAAGGMGFSDWFNQSWWQHGPFMPNVGRSLGSGVGGEADFNESIFVDGYENFGWGGTSFGCPTVAGVFADIESYLLMKGLSPFLGNGNPVTTLVGNAYFNGNLTLAPYSTVTNGTSYLANTGVVNGWSWPQGQNFPRTAQGTTTYGDTTPGWNFPTGWGSVNGYNFAVDLYDLYTMPGQFATMNSSGLNWDPSAWPNLALNHSYTFHVNASSTLQSTDPKVTLVFYDSSGVGQSWQPTLTPVAAGPGYDFTINTAIAPFDTPGYIYFEFGNSQNKTLGFDYDWIAQNVSTTGHLNVKVIYPSISSSGYPGGDAIFSAYLGWGGVGYGDYPQQDIYENSVQVLVTTASGAPVYDARVIADMPPTDEAFDLSKLDTNNYNYGFGAQTATDVMSSSFTNVSGVALVYTENVIKPVTIVVNASFEGMNGSTTFNETPMPNVKPVDAYGGNDSEFNLIQWYLEYWYPRSGQGHPHWNESNEDALVPNSWNQSSYYSLLYGWQGEELPIQVTNYTGAPVSGSKTFLGNWDLLGDQTPFTDYSATTSVFGITNTTGTANVTNSTGYTTLYIPDNQSAQYGIGYYGLGGDGDNLPYNTSSLDMIAVDLPGYSNSTFSYKEPCFYPFPLNPSEKYIPPYSCQFNATWDRNYSATPILVFPDPINITTETRLGIHQDFFSSGANISLNVQVQLPDNNPFNPFYSFNEPGTNWDPGLEHVTSVEAYVDGEPTLDLSPKVMDFQWWNITGNLTQTYSPGIHDLVIVVRDSLGHIFTQHKFFIVGSVTYTDLAPSEIYVPMPFNLTWNISIPDNEVNNKTFNMSLEIQYVTNGCGGKYCPLVVNQTIKVHPDQVSYLQNINRSLLATNDFYGGSGDFPPGQYAFTVWLGANHSGEVELSSVRYLVFDPLTVQIDGPSPNAVVPVGNLTISYSYDGLYIEGATVAVYPTTGTTPVFQAGAFVPGIGSRGSSTTWTSVSTGAYQIRLNITTPYQNLTTSEWINVTTSAPTVYLNQTHGQAAIMGLPTAATAVVLALLAAIVGMFIGRTLYTPSRRGGPPEGETMAGAGAAASKPAALSNECPICHERFETAGALANHRHLVHGDP
jgi:subtilase family serine protease